MDIIGTGTIVEVIPGEKYRIRHNLGKDSETGAYLKSPWKTVYCSKREAKHALEEYRAELIQQDYEKQHPELYIEIPTIKEYAADYLEARKVTKNLSANTIKKDEIDLRYVTELFGNFKLNNLKAQTINKRLVSYKKAEGCSLHKLNRIVKKLKALYKRATLEGIIEYRDNPCFGINIDKPEPPNRKSLSIDEFHRLESIIDSSPIDSYMVCIKIGLATGMRKGEVLGLTWKNTDLETGRIQVVQQYTQDGELKPPKSKAGYRTIYIDEDTIAYLKQWRLIQRDALELVGLSQGLKTPVTLRENGELIEPRCFARWFRDFCVQNGFGKYENTQHYWDKSEYHRRRKSGYKGLCFHELRHTQATLLIGSGCDIKTVQHRLGHADVETTLNTYSHTIDANDIAAANIIAGLKS